MNGRAQPANRPTAGDASRRERVFDLRRLVPDMPTNALPRPRLFDDFKRSDADFSRYDETDFDFWNRSAWQVAHDMRQRLEDWFSRYPVESAYKLRSDFRKPKKANGFHGAYFELFLHELLQRLGCHVTVNPTIEIRGRTLTPDFLVEYEGEKCYIEATQVDYRNDSNKNEDKFMQDLNEFPLPGWYGHLSPEGELNQTLSKEHVRRVIDFAKTLTLDDYEESYRGYPHSPSITVESPDGKWEGTIEFAPWKSSSNADLDRWLVGRGGSYWVDSEGIADKFIDRIVSKIRRYHHEIDGPLVVAVWDYRGQLGGFDKKDDNRIVFGSGQKHGGVWLKNDSPQHSELAGVWMFRGLAIQSSVHSTAYLYHNPYHSNPLPEVLRSIGYVLYGNEEISEWFEGKWLGELMMTVQDRQNLALYNSTYPPPTHT